MSRLFVLAVNAWQENLRGRFFLLSFFFGLILLYVSLLLGILAADQELRVLVDFGLALIEIIGLAGALFGACTALLREIENKTIYLVLSRPVRRWELLVGRFLGLMLSAWAAMAVMGLFHLALLFLKGWSWENAYLWAWLGSCAKVWVTASLGLFLSLFSSSVMTAGAIAAILWTLGHFLPEMRALIARSPDQAAALPMQLLSLVIPDLQCLNLRDKIAASSFDQAWLGLGYAALYSLVWTGLSVWLLKRKEF
ncbi:MAG: ABC transporter permease subunit [Elusimicrobia bacterium]|nr:ABC transporter permease subunit [Elusimicrobiota bacterium]